MIPVQERSCQFCKEQLPLNSHVCTICHQVQKDEKLVIEEFVQVAFLRFFVIFGSLIPICFFILWQKGDALKFEDFAIASFSLFKSLISISIFYFLLQIPFGFLIRKGIRNLNLPIPYIIEKTKYYRRKMIRNMVVYPTVSILLVYSMLGVINNVPSKSDFNEYLKEHPEYAQLKFEEVKDEKLVYVRFYRSENDDRIVSLIGIWNTFIPVSWKLKKA